MKKLFLVCSLVVALIGFMAFNAGATSIFGAISLSGNTIFDNTNLNLATMFTAFNGVTVASVDGDYSPITPGTPATFSLFTFRPPAASVIPLWTLDFDGNTYSLDATSVGIAYSDPRNIVLEGSGVAHITGKDDTNGAWSISANNAGQTFSFSSSSSVSGVPEPGTMLLLGSGMVGMAPFIRRKFKK